MLASELGDKANISYLESKEGWRIDSLSLLPRITSEFVFFWVEDQICVGGPDALNRVVADMHDTGAESLLYTAFHEGVHLQSHDHFPGEARDNIRVIDYDRAKHRSRLKRIREESLLCAQFVVSATSIFSRQLFARLLSANDPLVKRWPAQSPFDFEKSEKDTHWLPIRIALPVRELFAYIDDDHGRPGHSLMSRGLYPDRVSRTDMLKVRSQNFSASGPKLRMAHFGRVKEWVNRIHSFVRRLPALRFSFFL